MAHARARLGLVAVASAAMLVGMYVAAPRVSAQSEPTRVAYVDSAFVVSLHPAMATVDALIERARSELGELDRQLSSLDSRQRAGDALSVQETELFQVLLTARSSVQSRYESEIDLAVAPALTAAQEAIATVARDLDIAIVFEVNAGNDTGTIVYADPAVDITAAVADVMNN